MYNRYIPQPDGSYRRSRMPEPKPQGSAPRPPVPEPPPCAPEVHPEPSPPPAPPPRRQPPKHSDASSFLRQLLPKDFDTGDLIVILLLLLMAGDCEEDRNNAILTIALYFLM